MEISEGFCLDARTRMTRTGLHLVDDVVPVELRSVGQHQNQNKFWCVSSVPFFLAGAKLKWKLVFP